MNVLEFPKKHKNLQFDKNNDCSNNVEKNNLLILPSHEDEDIFVDPNSDISDIFKKHKEKNVIFYLF